MIRSYGFTDVGLKRDVNQDAILFRTQDQYGLYIVADGMGGHSKGEIASNELVNQADVLWNEFVKKEVKPTFNELVNEISKRLITINKFIYDNYNQGQVCGTTVVALLIYESYYAVFSVGDSRVYSQKTLGLKQLTFDDIWDNLPDVIQKFTEDEIKNSNNRGKLINSIGIKPEVTVRNTTGKISHNQKFILCSDGLYKFCNDSYINKCFIFSVLNRDLERIGKKLYKRVVENGAKDNVSFVIVSPGI